MLKKILERNYKIPLLEIVISFWFFLLLMHYFFSGSLWVWNISSVVPPLFYLLATLFLLLAYCFKLIAIAKNSDPQQISLIILLIFSSLLIALPISDINLYALHNFFDHSSLNFDRSISVFNWNTQFWEPEKNRAEFYQFLVEQDADVYQLQEFGKSSTFNLPVEMRQPFYDDEIELVEEYFPEYNYFYHGDLLTLSKYKIIENSEEFTDYWMKLDLRVNNDIISFYNVHLPVQFFGSGSGNIGFMRNIHNKFNLRQTEFESLEMSIKTNQFPFFISGDFNSTKSMGVMDEILELTQDSYSKSNRLYPATWEVWNLKLWRIDYSLVDKNSLKFLKHEDVDPRYFSDHWGQKTWIEVRD